MTSTELTDIINDVSMSAAKLLAWNLRRLRVAHGSSQKRLAADVTITCGYLSRIERGLENPTLEMLHRLATALAVPIAEFFVAPGIADESPRPLRGGRPRRFPAGHRGTAE